MSIDKSTVCFKIRPVCLVDMEYFDSHEGISKDLSDSYTWDAAVGVVREHQRIHHCVILLDLPGLGLTPLYDEKDWVVDGSPTTMKKLLDKLAQTDKLLAYDWHSINGRYME